MFGGVFESGPESDGYFSDCMLVDEKDSITCRVIRFMRMCDYIFFTFDFSHQPKINGIYEIYEVTVNA